MVDRSPLVLNVDDYEPGRYVRSQVLRRAGFRVAEAGTGDEAVRAVRAEPPDIVLLDVNLPDMSGYEVCRRIKAEPGAMAVPVLHVSATFVAERDQVTGLEGGADGYLTEPTPPAVLVATLKALLRARRAEEALRVAARQWKATFDAMSDGVAHLDVGGVVLRCNDAFARAFGLAVDEVVGRQHDAFWSPVGGPPPFATMLTTGRRETEVLPRGDRWFRATAEPVIDGDRLVGAVYVLVDVTEAKRADEERTALLARAEALRSEAEAANRAKDDFLAMLSHELRSPLNTTLGWVRLLRTGGLDAAMADRALITIERSVRSQAKLIEDLLDVSRIVSGTLAVDPRPVDMVEIVGAALDAVGPDAAGRGVTLDAAIAKRPSVVSGDPGRLQQMILNLLSNAIKFTPHGGRIHVHLTGGDATIVLRVSDTGIGIAPEFLPYVFDRFRQADSGTSRSNGGLGLGLAITRHVVMLHGGTITVSSDGVGRGATFTVTLPRSSATPGSAVAATGSATDATSLAGRTIVVVDDDAETRALLAAVLEGAGATVAAAANADDALAAIGTLAPDVILSDIALPGDSGYALVRRVRHERGDGVLAIALTAYATAVDEAQARAAGYDAHVAKPVDPAELVATIRRMLDGTEA